MKYAYVSKGLNGVEGCNNNDLVFKDGDEEAGRNFHDFRWRYATQPEIDEYKRQGEPYDVTTLGSLPTNKPYGEIELVEPTYPDFPLEGYCPNPVPKLVTFLREEVKLKLTDNGSFNSLKEGIAWNREYYWAIKTASSKPVYSMQYLDSLIKCNRVFQESNKLLNTNEKQNEQSKNSIKIGRNIPTIRSGQIPGGYPISGRVLKTTISSRPLSYTSVSVF